MTRDRFAQVFLESTPYCRCVRRAFLCGKDHYSGQDYEHRRQWVVDRLAVLAEVFAIDLCAYAVMSNHYHLVFRINQKKRWMQLFRGPLIVKRWIKGQLWREKLQRCSASLLNGTCVPALCIFLVFTPFFPLFIAFL